MSSEYTKQTQNAPEGEFPFGENQDEVNFYIKEKLIKDYNNKSKTVTYKDSPVTKVLIKRLSEGENVSVDKIKNEYKISIDEANLIYIYLIEENYIKKDYGFEELTCKNEVFCRKILDDDYLFNLINNKLKKRHISIEDKIISILRNYIETYELLEDDNIKKFVHDIEEGNINKDSIDIAQIQLQLRVGFPKANRIFELLKFKGYIK